MATFYVPFADPTPADPCPPCKGKGVTGAQYSMPLDDDKVMLIDVICGECGGCGSTVHDNCPPGTHALDGGDYPDDDDLEARERAYGCWSCGGRGWFVVQGFPPEAVAEDEILPLRAPCGCAEGRAQQLDVPAGAIS
ncbi:hypothetical protein ACFYOK_29570 [Microbispora bryophytorum]|uniref:hypothetical protein n=1 Tax=Microbispora bryophytorum TaxID=1460882 RepID=UPI00368B6619